METSILNCELVVKVPPGRYILGDPCYSINDDNGDWLSLLESCDFFTTPIGRVRNENVFAFSTYKGDGFYPGTDGHIYPVDSGIIGLVPIEFGLTAVRRRLCRSIRFNEETCCSSKDGILMFGNISINTLK